MESKMIRVINGQYIEKFCIPDGGYITVDGEPYQVHYIDETHFRIGSTYYHIREFGERVIDRGRAVHPYTLEA